MANLNTKADYDEWRKKQEFDAQRLAPPKVDPETLKLNSDIAKKFAAENPNVSPDRLRAIDIGQASLTPKVSDPYAASRAARNTDRAAEGSTQAQNSINQAAEVRNSLTQPTQQNIARGAAAVANSGRGLDPGSAQAQRELLYKAAKEHGAPNAESYRPPQPGLSTATRSQVEIDALARAAGPPAPPPQPQRSIEKPGLAVSANDQLDRMNAVRSPAAARPASTSGELTPYEHDMRALDIIRGDRENRIAQRALVPQQASVDTDRLSKIGNIMRFEMDSALRNTPGRSQAKAAAAQAIAESYKPEIEAITNKGKEANVLEKQRITNAADLQSKGNASDARIAAQESRNQMLEKLSKDRLDTQLALANRPRYVPAQEKYTDDYGEEVTNIVPFNTADGTANRSATGGLPGKEYAARQKAQELLAKEQSGKPLNPGEKAHLDKWRGTIITSG